MGRFINYCVLTYFLRTTQEGNMPAEKIEEVSLEELRLAIERLSEGTRAIARLVKFCEEKHLGTVWIYRRRSLRDAIQRLEPVVPEILRTIEAIVSRNPLGPDSTKRRVKVKTKAKVKAAAAALEAHQESTR